MQDKSIGARPPSGWERRSLRVAPGLPRYGEREAATRAANDRRRAREGYARRRAFVNAFKLEQGCADCGYRAHPAALTFDHLPGSQKAATVAWLAGWQRGSLAALRAEMAKCEVVCA